MRKFGLAIENGQIVKCVSAILAITTCVLSSAAAQQLPFPVHDAPGIQMAKTAGPFSIKAPTKRFQVVPLRFEQNSGQTDKSVRFLTHAPGYSMFLTDQEAVFAFNKPKLPKLKDTAQDASPSGSSVLRMRFIGSKGDGQVSGLDALPGRSNYMIGNDRSHWHTGIANYAKVQYKDVYPGVDVVYYGNDRKVEYDLNVSPGVDVNQIGLELSGAHDIHVDAKGDLVFKCDERELTMQKPVSYQISALGRRELVFGEWAVRDGDRVGFDIKGYDQTRTLIIDPALNFELSSFPFATYLGGSGSDYANGIAVDTLGAVYVTGNTNSTDFPTTDGVFQKTPPSQSGNQINAFAAKYKPDGTLIYATYLGGNSDIQNPGSIPSTYGYAIAVNGAGNAFIAGQTFAHGSFPSTKNTGCGTPLTATNCSNGFLIELSLDGSSLVYGEYVIGDATYALALDSNDNAYLTGNAFGGSPTAGSLQPNFGGTEDAFVAKIAKGGALSWWTYLGGSGIDIGQGIALDANGNVYVTGFTSNINAQVGPNPFPLKNALQPNFGGSYDAFVSEIDNSGTALIYSTFLGGSATELGASIAVDSAGDAYVTGHTLSSDFPTAMPLQPKYGGGSDFGDAFVSKISPKGTSLLYSTYLGGAGDDYGNGIAVDSDGNAYVTGAIGSAAGTDPTNANNTNTIGSIDSNLLNLSTNSIQPQCGDPAGCADAFVTAINSTGNQFLYFTYLGGNGLDYGSSIALDTSANCSQTSQLPSPLVTPCAYVAGDTNSTDFPVSDGTPLNGSNDAFIAQVPSIGLPVCNPTLIEAGLQLTVTITCTQNFSGGQGKVNWGDGTSFDPVSLQNSTDSSSVCHDYSSHDTCPTPSQLINLMGPSRSKSAVPYAASSSGSYTVSASMTNTAGTNTTYATPFPVIQIGPISVNVSAPSNTVQVPAQLQFSATVQNATVTSVAWYVNNVQGGNSGVGLISASGLYTPPSGLTNQISVMITAVSNADHATPSTPYEVTVVPPIAVAIATVPPSTSPVTLQAPATLQFQATVKNATDTSVNWWVNSVQGGDSSVGQISSTGLYTPPSSLTNQISVMITAVSNADQKTASLPFSVTVVPPTSVTIGTVPPSTSPATLQAPATLQFQATVKNAKDTSVGWFVNKIQGGNSTVGQISASGLYTPPATLGSPTTVSITAVANADHTASTPFQVIVNPVFVVTITPGKSSVEAGGLPFTITATVPSYSSNPNVTWTLTGTGCSGGPCGSISTKGPSTTTTYTPPALLSGELAIVDTVTATSVAAPAQSNSATITVNPPVVVSITPNGSFSIEVGKTQDFVSSVTGTSNTAVTWSVTGTGCGGAACGTITQAGHYVAPTTLTAAQTDTVVATSQAAPAKSASTKVAIFLPAVAPPPPSATITAGQSTQYQVTLTPGTGDPINPIALSCANLPNGTTCKFDPNPLTAGATSFTVTVTTTGSGTASLGNQHTGTRMLATFVPCLAFCFVGFFDKGFRSKLLKTMPLIVLSLLTSTFLTACGTSGSFGSNQLPSPSLTPVGTYSISVIGKPQVANGQVQPSPFQVTVLTLTVK